jgi:hypothetical protein
VADVNKGIINTGRIGGDASVEVHEEHIGDEVSVSASNSVVNLNSALENVEQKLRVLASRDESLHQELQTLFQQLYRQLSEIPEQRQEEVDAITSQAELVLAQTAEDKPKRRLLEISAEGLKQAAAFVKDITPDLLETASRIAAVIARLTIPAG